MATKYISPTGNDITGDGTYANPWATVSRAYAGSNSGDTILCMNGTFPWVSTTVSNRIIQAINPGQVTFDGAGADGRWQLASTNSGLLTLQDIIVQNIVITVSATPPWALFIPQIAGQSLAFTNCIFKLMTLCATSANGFITGISTTFSQCLFDDIKSSNNAPGWNGLFSPAANSTLAFLGCTFDMRETSDALYLPVLFFIGDNTSTIRMRNTIIRGNGVKTLKWFEQYGGSSPINDVANCDFMNVTGSPSGTGVITSDPLFVDAANGNFNLRPTSPCLDTGIIV
jgi:hypothetical protein